MLANGLHLPHKIDIPGIIRQIDLLKKSAVYSKSMFRNMCANVCLYQRLLTSPTYRLPYRRIFFKGLLDRSCFYQEGLQIEV